MQDWLVDWFTCGIDLIFIKWNELICFIYVFFFSNSYALPYFPKVQTVHDI